MGVVRALGSQIPLLPALRRLRFLLALRRTDTARIPFAAQRAAPCVAVGSLAEYRRYARAMASELESRRAVEQQLASGRGPLLLRGLDSLLGGRNWYFLDVRHAKGTPHGGINFRENLVDLRYGFTSRVRASMHSLYALIPRARLKGQRVYITEQTTPAYRYLRARFPNTVGSEYLGRDRVPGTKWWGLRHEDLTGLSFPDGSLDVLITLEVLEHIPDYRRALAEMARVIRAGGLALVTTPFDPNRETHLVRAELAPDGRITHHLPPEYHGDPLSPAAGILSFRVFGWDLLDELCAAGFRSAGALLSWDLDNAILGNDIFVLYAWK